MFGWKGGFVDAVTYIETNAFNDLRVLPLN